jgi:hypothetical protein
VVAKSHVANDGKMVSQILALECKSCVRNVFAARLRDYFVFARLRDCTMGCLA